ncbi:unnamed protein product [Bursaphelenchus xylophilus]|uniref:(pine wood nematode) hypothetical protein n=1 Tax=Bursaphelenchus xylophilus TaxID=6326 RepID=A0A7I8XBE0_BURXY|nr:unnamed protein product [Bursaphelenchus xylophilus]CAG9082382.1 unnamed protein product [Bursaphelenchus xylophilus]
MSQCTSNCEASKRRKYLEIQINALKERVDRNPEVYHEFFGNSDFSDFQIKAGGKTFYVTKYQLAHKSKVFANMFMVNMREKKEGVMKIDADAETVEAMLEYIYMFKKVKGSELARKVVQLAHCYEIDDLKEQCELEILENLTVNDAEDSLLLAAQLKLPLVFLKCNEFLLMNFVDFGETVITLSEAEVAFMVYSSEPLTSRMKFKVIQPFGEVTLASDELTHPNCPTSSMGFVYFAPYVEGLHDYDQLHLLPNARYLPVEFKDIK